MARYFVDPETGETMIQRDDGTIVPYSEASGVPQDPHGREGEPITDADPNYSGGYVPLTGEPEEEPVSDENAGSYTRGSYGSRRPYPSRGYSGRRYGSDYDDQGGGYLPPYANGLLHPSRTGGQLATGLQGLGDRIRAANGQPPKGGYDDREQIYSPSGASAGPFGVQSPRSALEKSPLYTRGATSGSGGGGGGNTSPLYDQLRAKGDAMAAKVRGMASGIGSGGGSYTSGGYSTPQYSSSSYTAAAPAEPRMRGLAKGMDPAQAGELSYRPSMLIPELFPGLSGASPLYQAMAELPAAAMGMLSKRGYDGGPSDLVNAIGGVYEGFAEDRLPSFDEMFRNLSNPKQGGGIDTMFSGEKAGKGDIESTLSPGYVYGAEPPLMGESATAYSPMLDAALMMLPGPTAAKYSSSVGGYGSYLMDRWGSRAIKRPPGKGRTINEYVGRRLMR
jgi:hypothetical protein